MAHSRSGQDAAIHLVLRVSLEGVVAEIEDGRGSGFASDAPAVESQRVRNDGDSLRRQVLHVYPVAEPQSIVADKPLK